jgi:hypothetical protein
MALVLFWAEIIHHAKHHERSRLLRPLFLAANAMIYAAETVLIVLMLLEKGKPSPDAIVIGLYDLIDHSFFSTLALLIALGFLVYGWRLFALLKSNPISSQGRTAKLREVGSVTAICVTCFTLRATMKILMITAPFRKTLVYSWAYSAGRSTSSPRWRRRCSCSLCCAKCRRGTRRKRQHLRLARPIGHYTEQRCSATPMCENCRNRTRASLDQQ